MRLPGPLVGHLWNAPRGTIVEAVLERAAGYCEDWFCFHLSPEPCPALNFLSQDCYSLSCASGPHLLNQKGIKILKQSSRNSSELFTGWKSPFFRKVTLAAHEINVAEATTSKPVSHNKHEREHKPRLRGIWVQIPLCPEYVHEGNSTDGEGLLFLHQSQRSWWSLRRHFTDRVRFEMDYHIYVSKSNIFNEY